MTHWTILPEMPTRRHDHTCVIHAGQLLVIAGFNDVTTFATTECFDLQTASWIRSRSPIPTPRGLFGSTVAGDDLYVIGGKALRPAFVETRTGPQYDVYATVERYRLETDQWESLPSLPEPRAGLGAATWDDTVLAVGGMHCPEPDRFPDPALVTSQVDVLDLTTERWTPGPQLPDPRYGPAVHRLGAHVIVAGGSRDGEPRDDVFALETDTQTWTRRASIPRPIRDAASVVVGDDLYLIGGLAPDGDFRNEVYRYDPQADTWTTHCPHPTSKAWGDAATDGESIYVVGGASRSPSEEQYVFFDEIHAADC